MPHDEYIPEPPLVAVEVGDAVNGTSVPRPAPLALRLARRSIHAIVADLSRPLPSGCVASKPASSKGGTISYLHWQTVARLLDLYAPGWHGAVVRVEKVGDKCGITYRLMIPSSEGEISREATGMEDEDKDDYGDAMSNAEAKAFKRAAAKFGLGSWLYDKDQTADALTQYLRQEKMGLLEQLGQELDRRHVPRQAVLAWLKRQTSTQRTVDIPVALIKAVLADLDVMDSD